MYLEKIVVKNFKIIKDFEFSLPKGPGFTLLIGQNGLGKSTFFEAIEWNLTDRIKRLDQKHLSQYLPHIGVLMAKKLIS